MIRTSLGSGSYPPGDQGSLNGRQAPLFLTKVRRLDTFYGWLCLQTERTDTVGVLARYAVKDKIFPRTGRKLSLFLHRFEHVKDLRDATKLSHAEWRQLRRGKRR